MKQHEFLVMKDINKSYGSIRALQEVDFSADSGEVHAIVGENGAGKSTLVKILTGAVSADKGAISIAGEDTPIASPIDAQRLGIRAVHQHFSLVPHLSVTENIMLGDLPAKKAPFYIDWNEAHNRARKTLERIGLEGIDVRTPVSKLSVPQKQMIEIAKAVAVNSRILIMDEPSAVLSQKELDVLFDLIRKLKEQAVLILYISHRLDEVFKIADRVTVLKDGRNMGTVQPADIDKPTLIKMMVGRAFDEVFPERRVKEKEVLLDVIGLSREGVFKDVTFSVIKGEILGFYGLVGSGRTEVARCIFGADRLTSGKIALRKKAINPYTPNKALNAGIAMLTEDRNHDGLVLFLPIRDNVSLASMPSMSTFGVLNMRRQKSLVLEMVRKLRIKPADIKVPVQTLSGGNQQKVALAKWLLVKNLVLILDEPTRGVDVATKHELYAIVRSLADEGIAILLISSELPEVIGLSDRVIVMREGSLEGEFTREEATEENLLACAAGITTIKGGTIDG